MSDKTVTTKCLRCGKTVQNKTPGGVTYVEDIRFPDFCQCKPEKSLEQLKDELVSAAIRWYNADIYVHPVLDRATAIKVGVADLLDAVQNYKNEFDKTQVAQNAG